MCAAALTVVLVLASSDDGPPLAKNWSTWQPETTEMLEGAQAIAAARRRPVRARRRRAADQGAQLGAGVRRRAARRRGAADRRKLQFLEGDGLLYVLNGLGPGGAVAGGEATKERGRLLMREALELSLYSFRYLDDVTMVGVLLPPSAANDDPTQAVFYRPGDLLDQLQVPLARTLSPRTPRPRTMSAAESGRVDSLVLRNLFLASVQPVKDDETYLLLTEPDSVE